MGRDQAGDITEKLRAQGYDEAADLIDSYRADALRCLSEIERLRAVWVPTLDTVIRELYDSEINATISWVWDGGFDLAIGDQYNGIREAGNVDTTEEAAHWFVEHGKRLWPNSQFAKSF
jgi:hypothetical protein